VIARKASEELRERLETFAGAILVGPGDIGKSTLARQVADAWPAGAVHLDLGRIADRRRLSDPGAFFRAQAPHLVVVDQVHKMPEVLAVLKDVIEDNRSHGQRTGEFLLISSVSLNRLPGAEEHLARRISVMEIFAVAPDEAAEAGIELQQLWLRGGFPDSLTANSDLASVQWRDCLVDTYMDRDVPHLAPRVDPDVIRRLWTMLAYSSGDLLNSSRLSENLGVSPPTVSRHIGLLEDLGLVRLVEPWPADLPRRLTKSPRVYVRDTGLLHSLVEIGTTHDLLGHPSVGSSFRSLVVESLITAAPPSWKPYFFRTASGTQIDLVFARGNTVQVGVQIGLTGEPATGTGFHRACDALGISRRFVVRPDSGTDEDHPQDSTSVGLTDLVRRWRDLDR